MEVIVEGDNIVWLFFGCLFLIYLIFVFLCKKKIFSCKVEMMPLNLFPLNYQEFNERSSFCYKTNNGIKKCEDKNGDLVYIISFFIKNYARKNVSLNKEQIYFKYKDKHGKILMEYNLCNSKDCLCIEFWHDKIEKDQYVEFKFRCGVDMCRDG